MSMLILDGKDTYYTESDIIATMRSLGEQSGVTELIIRDVHLQKIPELHASLGNIKILEITNCKLTTLKGVG